MAKKVILLFLVLAALLTACDSAERDANYGHYSENAHTHDNHHDVSEKQQQIFKFGFDLRSSPQEDAKQYLPFLEYLERKTGYRFKLKFTPKDKQLGDLLGTGERDFGAVGAVTFIIANKKYGVTPLVRGINMQGKAEYRSMLVVRPGSKVSKLSDIAGLRMAFGSSDSTQGHLIPRIIMDENNIKLDSFSSHTFTDSHQSCANMVINNTADVCGMQDVMADNLAEQGKIKILHKSNYFPSSGIVAAPGLDQDVIMRVQQALIDFDPQGYDSKGLYHWDKTEMAKGFVKSSTNDYKSMTDALYKIGLLE